MSLKNYIEKAEKKAGSQIDLGKILEQSPSKLRQAKAGKCGLPVAVCYQIAELIGEDERHVVAASELITEKKPERRAILLPFVRNTANAILIGVILNMTPTPAEAATMLQANDLTLYIMSNYWWMLVPLALLAFAPPQRSKPLTAGLVVLATLSWRAPGLLVTQAFRPKSKVIFFNR